MEMFGLCFGSFFYTMTWWWWLPRYWLSKIFTCLLWDIIWWSINIIQVNLLSFNRPCFDSTTDIMTHMIKRVVSHPLYFKATGRCHHPRLLILTHQTFNICLLFFLWYYVSATYSVDPTTKSDKNILIVLSTNPVNYLLYTFLAWTTRMTRTCLPRES